LREFFTAILIITEANDSSELSKVKENNCIQTAEYIEYNSEYIVKFGT